MKTFEIANGDLVVGPGGFTVLEGTQKVFQDLGVAIREPLGVDRFHTRWGSLLEEYIALQADDHAKMLIQAEITRLVRNYMAVQQGYMNADITVGRKPRFGTNEIVIDIKDIQIVQDLDRFHVKVTLVTQSGDEVTLAQSVGV